MHGRDNWLGKANTYTKLGYLAYGEGSKTSTKKKKKVVKAREVLDLLGMVEGDDPSTEYSRAMMAKYPELEDFWVSFYKDQMDLSNIIIKKEHRKEGIGHKVMQDLTDYADKNNKTITLSPDTSLGGTSKDRLIKFYRQFGFVRNKGRTVDYRLSGGMYRRPQGKSEYYTDVWLSK